MPQRCILVNRGVSEACQFEKEKQLCQLQLGCVLAGFKHVQGLANLGSGRSWLRFSRPSGMWAEAPVGWRLPLWSGKTCSSGFEVGVTSQKISRHEANRLHLWCSSENYVRISFHCLPPTWTAKTAQSNFYSRLRLCAGKPNVWKHEQKPWARARVGQMISNAAATLLRHSWTPETSRNKTHGKYSLRAKVIEEAQPCT